MVLAKKKNVYRFFDIPLVAFIFMVVYILQAMLWRREAGEATGFL